MNQISLISSLFALYVPHTIRFSTMIIHSMSKYLRSLISVQGGHHVACGELMSSEIKRPDRGGARARGIARREQRLFEPSLWIKQD